MLIKKYECGCIGLPPLEVRGEYKKTGEPREGLVIVLQACDGTEDDMALGEAGSTRMGKRWLRNTNYREAISMEQYEELEKKFNELFRLALVGASMENIIQGIVFRSK